MEESVFESYDGTLLQKYVFNCENPKAIVQIAHGMQEYSATYFEFAQFLADNGYMVVLFDQRGHGKSVKPKDIGKINKEKKIEKAEPTKHNLSRIKNDIFKQTVLDHILMTKKLKSEYNLPVYYIGHSYGSFIGQSYLQECADADKIVLIGSGYMKKPLIYFGRIIAKLSTLLQGHDCRASLVETLSFDAYKKKFEDGSWITSDQNETEKFYADPLNGTPFSVGFYDSMFKNQIRLPNTKKLQYVNKQRPVLITSGSDDVIGDMGKGVLKLYQVYLHAGLNVSLKLYPKIRHAILQEVNKYEVYDEILDFLNKNEKNTTKN